MSTVKIGLCQLNLTVGDLEGNVDKILTHLFEADRQGCNIALTPELAVCGYPPEDLLYKTGFVDRCDRAITEIARQTRNLSVIAVIGHVSRALDHGYHKDPTPAPGLINCASIIGGGHVLARSAKRLLPNYSVFDEVRYFSPGLPDQPIVSAGQIKFGVTICEDIWAPGPTADLVNAGAQLVVVLNASPFFSGRIQDRIEVASLRATENSVPVAYVNLVGGQDELVFDGGSFVIDSHGNLVSCLAQFEEALGVVEVELDPTMGSSSSGQEAENAPQWAAFRKMSQDEEIYSALVMGTRDYVYKNGFSEVVIGLSGGIDSALVSVIAADALGPDRVHCVAMPSKYSSPESLVDAHELCKVNQIELRVIPIIGAHEVFSEMLAGATFSNLARVRPQPPSGLADENLQSRIRGITLMALSNQHGWLVLTTGNKSELAVGYSTLYGDTAGGFGVIKDVDKTSVYKLCEYRNSLGPGTIPSAIIQKPPSAELRHDQRDDQSLPPYDLLDSFLADYVNRDLSYDQLVDMGYDPALVARLVKMVDRAEYKRRQNPPGVRVSQKAFGKDRRMPITNKFEEFKG